MAKGNMLQGMARGKVGDVVFSRLNGEQISRVRNRHPKNPRSAAQLYQRAIMATVAQAYAAGSVIFDHAFQGRAVGVENQRRFLQLNAKRLRSQIAADINGSVAVAQQVGRVVAPGSVSPVPASLQVSEGSLANPFPYFNFPTITVGSTIASYATVNGLRPGDLFTFVALVIPPNASTLFSVEGYDTNMAKQYSCEFLFARYAVKEDAFDDETTAVEATRGDLLELTDSNFVPDVSFLSNTIDSAVNLNNFITGTNKGVFACIRSRLNEDLRSTEFLKINGTTDFGIASQFALAAWQQGTESLGNSDLILEGGDI